MPRAWSFLLLFLLVGCGGGGGDTAFIEGRNGSVALNFSEATEFNGNAGALNGYTTLDGSATRKIVTVNATNVNRGVEAVLVKGGLKEGDSVDLAGLAGPSAVAYSETNGRWIATSGTLTLQSRTTTSASLLLTDVVVTGNSGGATGTVKINGTMTFVGG